MASLKVRCATVFVDVNEKSYERVLTDGCLPFRCTM